MKVVCSRATLAACCLAWLEVGVLQAQTTRPQSWLDAEQIASALVAACDSGQPERALAEASVRQAWRQRSDDEPAAAFIEAALCRLYPRFAEALALFDAGRLSDAARSFAVLREHENRFVAAAAVYYHARCLVAEGRFAEVAAMAADLEPRYGWLGGHTPLAGRFYFLVAASAVSELDYDAADSVLDLLESHRDVLDELTRVGAKQLRLQVEQRQEGTLGEVADLMEYSARRLGAGVVDEQLEKRQRRIIALLDELIRKQRQKECARCRGGGERNAGGPGGGQARSRSEVRPGRARIGRLHSAPAANPGEAWGKLPPAERQRILQNIRERFPSRYRQLVEQYYRTLSEQQQ